MLRQGERPNLMVGDYVVRKPDYGAKGAEVRIKRAALEAGGNLCSGPASRVARAEFITLTVAGKLPG
jgi:hypothetical protein